MPWEDGKMKILISACLLGIPCRYDGKAKPQPWAEALAADPAVGPEWQATHRHAIVSDLKHRPFF